MNNISLRFLLQNISKNFCFFPPILFRQFQKRATLISLSAIHFFLILFWKFVNGQILSSMSDPWSCLDSLFLSCLFMIFNLFQRAFGRWIMSFPLLLTFLKLLSWSPINDVTHTKLGISSIRRLTLYSTLKTA